jgi:hypothetical protein
MGPETDPYEGVVAYANAANVQRLCKALNLSSKTLDAAMAPSSSRSRYCQSFRYCVACVGRGYHSLLLKSPGLSVCSAHRTRILAARRRCRYEAPYIVRAELMGTPYRCANCRWNYGGTRLQSQSALSNAARASDCLHAALPSTILLLSRAGRRDPLSPTHRSIKYALVRVRDAERQVPLRIWRHIYFAYLTPVETKGLRRKLRANDVE